MGDRDAKNARAKARKQKFLEFENQLRELQDRISASSAKPVRTTSERSQKPQRRNSVTQFFREMFDSQAALESAMKKKKQQRRGSGTVVQGNKIVVHDKRGRKIAEFPVHKKTERIADNDSANPTNQTEFAKALRRVRNQMIPGDEEDEFDDDVRADRYARDEFGAIKEKCTTLQKIFGLKCDKVMLTQEERKRNLAQKKAEIDGRKLPALRKVVPLPDMRGFRGLTPGEKRLAAKRETEMNVNIAQAQARAELDALGRGRRGVVVPPTLAGLFADKKDKFKGIPELDYVDEDMQEGDEPVLDDEISTVDGRQVRLRFIPPKQPGFLARMFNLGNGEPLPF
jgi:hypothetical protein